MKHILTLLFAFAFTAIYAGINIRVSGMIFNAQTKSVELVRANGTEIKVFFKANLDKEGNFEIKGEVPKMDYYQLKVGSELIQLILRDQSDIKIYGDGKKLRSFVNIVDSEESSNFHAYYQTFENWKRSSDSATALIKAQPENAETINRDMSAKFQRFQGETKAFIARNSNSPALFAAIPAIDANSDFPSYEAVSNQLFTCFGQSDDIARLKTEYEKAKLDRMANDKFAPGKEAPDFTEKMPDGKDLSLSDLRGNVVLLDFWASWCGPCRRANPHVVQLYEKYKDKGFTVMSVSLDKDRERWLEAIQKDNLSWPNHVSDLQYWSSKAAQLYGVKGIPFTMLIDAEGKIIRKNPNTQELDAELIRIFGN